VKTILGSKTHKSLLMSPIDRRAADVLSLQSVHVSDAHIYLHRRCDPSIYAQLERIRPNVMREPDSAPRMFAWCHVRVHLCPSAYRRRGAGASFTFSLSFGDFVAPALLEDRTRS